VAAAAQMAKGEGGGSTSKMREDGAMGDAELHHRITRQLLSSGAVLHRHGR
jgi:hypothetical protein